MQYRNSFVESSNRFLFAACTLRQVLSFPFRKHVGLAVRDTRQIAALTSSKLHKQLTTMAQILNITNEDLQELARFMEVTIKTHNNGYGLPFEIYQTANFI